MKVLKLSQSNFHREPSAGDQVCEGISVGLVPGDKGIPRTLGPTKYDAFSPRLGFEAFNLFNHAQFINPSVNIRSGTFGMVGTARDPRIMQVAGKFIF